MNKGSHMLESLLAGNSEGIQEIYKLIFPKVLVFVKKNSGTADDARDVFQKTLLQLISRFKVVGDFNIDSFEAYVFTAAKNLWRRELNKKNRVTTLGAPELYDNSEEKDMALSLLEQDRQDLFHRCFRRLSENCQKILKMYFDKISYGTMKTHFEYSSETVARQRVFKCKSKLSDFIKNDSSYNSLRHL